MPHNGEVFVLHYPLNWRLRDTSALYILLFVVFLNQQPKDCHIIRCLRNFQKHTLCKGVNPLESFPEKTTSGIGDCVCIFKPSKSSFCTSTWTSWINRWKTNNNNTSHVNKHVCKLRMWVFDKFKATHHNAWHGFEELLNFRTIAMFHKQLRSMPFPHHLLEVFQISLMDPYANIRLLYNKT